MNTYRSQGGTQGDGKVRVHGAKVVSELRIFDDLLIGNHVVVKRLERPDAVDNVVAVVALEAEWRVVECECEQRVAHGQVVQRVNRAYRVVMQVQDT